MGKGERESWVAQFRDKGHPRDEPGTRCNSTPPPLEAADRVGVMSQASVPVLHSRWPNPAPILKGKAVGWTSPPYDSCSLLGRPKKKKKKTQTNVPARRDVTRVTDSPHPPKSFPVLTTEAARPEKALAP